MPKLVLPALAYAPSFVAALREGYNRDTLRAETPESIAAVEADLAAFVESQLTPPAFVTLPDGGQGPAVPFTTLWYVEGDEFLGAISIRHHLNENLEKVGGHVGYVVRPAARGKGYASAILAEGLGWIRANLPLTRVLLTVNKLNPASIRVIEKNGGVFTQALPHIWRPGETALHYWIDL